MRVKRVLLEVEIPAAVSTEVLLSYIRFGLSRARVRGKLTTVAVPHQEQVVHVWFSADTQIGAVSEWP